MRDADDEAVGEKSRDLAGEVEAVVPGGALHRRTERQLPAEGGAVAMSIRRTSTVSCGRATRAVSGVRRSSRLRGSRPVDSAQSETMGWRETTTVVEGCKVSRASAIRCDSSAASFSAPSGAASAAL